MYKTVVLSAVIVLLSLAGCKKKKDKDPCDGLYCDFPSGPTFHFIFKDKSTGQDLFFSAPPKYPFSALTGTVPSVGPLNILVDTFNTRHDLVISVIGTGRDTFYFNIAGTKTDTLLLESQFYSVSCCVTGAKLTNIRFNGQLVAAQFDTQQSRDSVLNFYK
jgi:hypothetical protein